MRLQLDMALVRNCLSHGVAVTRLAWKKCPGILILMLAAILGADYLGLALAHPGLANFGLLLVYNLASIAAYGAVYRLAAGDDEAGANGLGPWGFQWRALEGRLLGAALLLVLLFVFAIVLVVFLLLALAAIIAYGHGHELTLSSPAAIGAELGLGGIVVMLVCCGLAFAALAILYLRLCLSGPASAYLGKISVLSTLGLTKNRVLSLLFVFGAIYGAMVLFMLGGEVLIAALFRLGMDLSGLRVGFSVLYTGLGTLVVVPMVAATQAALYRALKAGHNPPEYPLESGEKD
jgi:hypothetical protein